MKNSIWIILLLVGLLPGIQADAKRYAGGDISLLPDYEKAGVTYRDLTGNVIPDLLPWLKKEGMNAMRVRLFVNPSKYKELHANDSNQDTKYDPNACQDLDYILPLCKRIVENGFDLMLDFHYSDTWADPAKQWTPIDWVGLSDEELYQKIYDYTKETLETLKAEGIVPAFIQPGNEISYGMLWGPVGTTSPKKAMMGSSANWGRFGTLLNRAILACREVCPEAKIVIHTERTNQTSVEKNFYDKMKELNVDYDIIGLSYYPYWHGYLSSLESSLSMLSTNYPEKDIMIVETGYSYAWSVPGSTINTSGTWPFSAAGQNAFAQDIVSLLEKYPHADGLFWWWMEYNAYDNKLSGWYNAPLFDSRDGKALPALKTICSFADSSGVRDIVEMDETGDGMWYDLQGRPVKEPTAPGIYVSKRGKIFLGRN